MGQCHPNGNGFICKCQPGFTGQKCESRDPCTPNPVNNYKLLCLYFKLYRKFRSVKTVFVCLSVHNSNVCVHPPSKDQHALIKIHVNQTQ